MGKAGESTAPGTGGHTRDCCGAKGVAALGAREHARGWRRATSVQQCCRLCWPSARTIVARDV